MDNAVPTIAPNRKYSKNVEQFLGIQKKDNETTQLHPLSSLINIYRRISVVLSNTQVLISKVDYFRRRSKVVIKHRRTPKGDVICIYPNDRVYAKFIKPLNEKFYKK